MKFFAKLRRKLFSRRIHQEIGRRIFPQLAGEKNCSYPFNDSVEDLEKLATFGALDVQLKLDIIERRAMQLPDTYRQAFRYIAYRDINERLKMYLEFVQERTPLKAPATPLKQQVAT